MKHEVKINKVELNFEELPDGRIAIGFETSLDEDADNFIDRLSLELANYKGMLADQKRRAQLKRDREARLHELQSTNDLLTDAEQAERIHLLELRDKGEL